VDKYLQTVSKNIGEKVVSVQNKFYPKNNHRVIYKIPYFFVTISQEKLLSPLKKNSSKNAIVSLVLFYRVKTYWCGYKHLWLVKTDLW